MLDSATPPPSDKLSAWRKKKGLHTGDSDDGAREAANGEGSEHGWKCGDGGGDDCVRGGCAGRNISSPDSGRVVHNDREHTRARISAAICTRERAEHSLAATEVQRHWSRAYPESVILCAPTATLCTAPQHTAPHLLRNRRTGLQAILTAPVAYVSTDRTGLNSDGRRGGRLRDNEVGSGGGGDAKRRWEIDEMAETMEKRTEEMEERAEEMDERTQEIDVPNIFSIVSCPNLTRGRNTTQHTATHSITPQHAASHCITLGQKEEKRKDTSIALVESMSLRECVYSMSTSKAASTSDDKEEGVEEKDAEERDGEEGGIEKSMSLPESVYLSSTSTALQHAATRCYTLQHTMEENMYLRDSVYMRSTSTAPQHAATRCNALQHTVENSLSPREIFYARSTSTAAAASDFEERSIEKRGVEEGSLEVKEGEDGSVRETGREDGKIEKREISEGVVEERERSEDDVEEREGGEGGVEESMSRCDSMATPGAVLSGSAAVNGNAAIIGSAVIIGRAAMNSSDAVNGSAAIHGSASRSAEDAIWFRGDEGVSGILQTQCTALQHATATHCTALQPTSTRFEGNRRRGLEDSLGVVNSRFASTAADIDERVGQEREGKEMGVHASTSLGEEGVPGILCAATATHCTALQHIVARLMSRGKEEVMSSIPDVVDGEVHVGNTKCGESSCARSLFFVIV